VDEKPAVVITAVGGLMGNRLSLIPVSVISSEIIGSTEVLRNVNSPLFLF
jgi:hypothetical protein